MTTEDVPTGGRPAIPDNEIIERFGGIRPMASKLGVAVTTVQGWKERGHIPAGRWQQIAEAAAAHGVDLGAAATPPSAEMKPPKPAEAKPAEAKPAEAKPAETKPAAPKPAEAKPAAAKPAAARPTDAKPVEAAEAKSTAAEADAAKSAAPPAPQPARPAPGAGRGAGIAWAALIVAFALALAVLTRPFWEPVLYQGGIAGFGAGDPAAIERIAAELSRIESAIGEIERELRGQGDAMETRISALEAGGGEAGAAFASQLDGLETRMADLATSVNGLSTGLARVEQRLAALEAAQEQIPAPVQRELGEVTGRIDRLQSGLETQQSALKDGLGAVDTAAAALAARVTELESRPIQTGEKIAALALAVGQLEAALDSGKPYRSALDRLYAIGHDDPVVTGSGAMAVLAPWADYGIPDRLALHRRFVEITPQIDRALASSPDEGWLESVWNSIRGLVTIRRVDGGDALSPVSRAEIAMEDGDLAAAVGAFDGVGSLGAEGDAWLNLVRERLAAEREIEALYGRIIAPLAGRAGTGAPAQ